MPDRIKEPYLSGVKEFVERKLGLHFTVLRENELSRKLETAADYFGYSSLDEFIKWMLSSVLSRKSLEKLASFLTIGETYFLRETEAFEFLRNEYLKKFIYESDNHGKTLKVWSAGCSSGEEVYSLAGLIRELIPDQKQWQVKLTGTDINPDVLEKARLEVYSDWSFRNTPEWFMKKYIQKIEDTRYRICDCLRENVDFQLHNLATDLNIFSDVNIIFCRNVLIYFSRELAKKVTAKFYDSLAEGGLLVVSPVETTLDIYDQFIRSSYQGRSFYLKESGSSQALIYNGYEFELPGHDIESKKENLPDTSKPEGESEYERIVFLFEEGLYLRVENLIKQISAVDKLPLEYQLLLGHTYIRLGKHKEAEELLEEIVQKKPEIMRAHYLLGKLYKQTHERKKSVSSFKEAEKLLKRQGDTVEQAKNPVDLRSIGQEIQKELKDQEEIYG